MAHRPVDVADATLRLLLAPGLGPMTLRKLRKHLGSDAAIVGAAAHELAKIKGIGGVTADALRRAIDASQPEVEREAMDEVGARLILRGDTEYPALLAAIPDAPEALWFRGAFAAQDHFALAIVGSRRCSNYGREQAARFSALLADCGLTIVSGGAVGIDSEAHRGALRVGGRTIAVLGCGLGHCYPPRNASLFEQIIASEGALLSEFPTTLGPLAAHFPRRNRIIAGLALGVLVIDAGRRSGSLITARRAGEDYGREVMAVPGRVDATSCAGCLRLIQAGAAALVTDHTDVVRQLDGCRHLVRGAIAKGGRPGEETGTRDTLFDLKLSPTQQAIVDALEKAEHPRRPDQLANATQLMIGPLMSDLTVLEIRGRVRRVNGGFLSSRPRAADNGP